jgi:Restriction endonuclease
MAPGKPHFTQVILAALKDAAVKLFWKKEDLRRVLNIAGVPARLIAAQDWDIPKYKVISPILDALNSDESGIGPLRALLHETLSYKDAKHLLWLPDGKEKRKDAERALAQLRELVDQHDTARRTQDEERQAILNRRAENNRYKLFNEKLKSLKESYESLCVERDSQKRGFALEKLLNELFALFEMSPKAPFRRTGEQIDGAFTLEGDHYLLEAKWQDIQINLADLKVFDGSVESSLDNTLGLFISINGFSPQAIEGYLQGRRPRIICMDGSDLYLVLDSRIDLGDLLTRKKDIAVQKRVLLASASDIIAGKY